MAKKRQKSKENEDIMKHYPMAEPIDELPTEGGAGISPVGAAPIDVLPTEGGAGISPVGAAPIDIEPTYTIDKIKEKKGKKEENKPK